MRTREEQHKFRNILSRLFKRLNRQRHGPGEKPSMNKFFLKEIAAAKGRHVFYVDSIIGREPILILNVGDNWYNKTKDLKVGIPEVNKIKWCKAYNPLFTIVH